jgi:hypothetical protein
MRERDRAGREINWTEEEEEGSENKKRTTRVWPY